MGHAEVARSAVTADLERQILQAIKDVRYGSVEIIIHDSQVVQIERKEKIRFLHTQKKTKSDNSQKVNERRHADQMTGG